VLYLGNGTMKLYPQQTAVVGFDSLPPQFTLSRYLALL